MAATKTPETGNQSWRKKPRKFSPKSRRGCKTCKVRRIKCDEARPSCSKCQSTGRTCDGYDEADLNMGAAQNQHNDSYVAFSHVASASSVVTSPRPRHWHGDPRGLAMRNLGPLLVLPVTSSTPMEALSFFEYISIKDLNEYRQSEPWHRTLMYFYQTVPPVRHAAIALALLHRSYYDGHSVRHPDTTHLVHYNRAIRLLLAQKSDDKVKTLAVTLLVCYLFTCFENLAGNHIQAFQHLHGGVELSRNIDKAMLGDENSPRMSEPSVDRMLLSQVVRQVRRLDMQAVAVAVSWNPVDIQETPVFQHVPSDGAFESLDQASNHLQILIARVMRLHWTSHPTPLMDQESPEPPSSRIIVLQQLSTWSSLFETMIRRGTLSKTHSENRRHINLLRLQHTTIWILLQSIGPAREMEFDKFLPEFQRCVAMADEVVSAHQSYSGSLKPTFTPEVGILPVLYILGVKCRHPTVRREVVSILRRLPIREAVWHSFTAASVVERIIEIEEAGLGQSGTWSMEQITIWNRVESVSWQEVVHGESVVSLNLQYTLCLQEGKRITSVPM